MQLQYFHSSLSQKREGASRDAQQDWLTLTRQTTSQALLQEVADVGQVWGDNRSKTNPAIVQNDDFDSRNWRTGAGGGIQYRLSKSFAFRIELGHSNERNLIYFSFSRGF
jgi:hypothetical protein